MNKELRRSLHLYYSKIALTILFGFAVLLLFILSSSYRLIMNLNQNITSKKLHAITKTLALNLDANELNYLLKTHLNQDDIIQSEENVIYNNIHRKLYAAAKANDLSTPIYTLTRSSVRHDEFFFGVTSAKKPYFRHFYQSDNQAYQQYYETGGVIGIYDDMHGKWVSAFSPIKSGNQVVAILQADEKFDYFITDVKRTFLSYLLVSILIILTITLIVAFIIKKHFYKGVREYQRIEKSMRRAKKSNEIKSEFVSMVSHEMRTPMNGVIGMTDVLLDSNINSEQQELLYVIKNSANSLLVILNDILDFSKIEAGKLELENISFNLREQIDEVVSIHKFEIEKKSLQFDLTLSDDNYSYIVGDPVRIKQIIGNFMSNAIKFTPTGTVALRAFPVSKTLDSMRIRFEVSDEGIGIPADKINLLFQSFQQIDSSTTRNYGGSGMGLAICKKLTELMGGTIGVSSKIDVGSIFWFEIVVQKGEKPHLEPLETDSELRSDIKILIAEDSLVNQKVISEMMKKLGLQYSIVSNGFEAVEIFKKKFKGDDAFDLIFMDIQMPKMNGLDACQKIRNFSSTEIPIVALTASATTDDETKCLELGMSDYISKPIHLETLKETIIKWTE